MRAQVSVVDNSDQVFLSVYPQHDRSQYPIEFPNEAGKLGSVNVSDQQDL